MNQRLRIVLAGCGAISRVWLEAASKEAGLEIAGLVDLQEEAAVKRKTDYKLEHAVTGTDLKSMLERVRPDAVFNCTVPEAHLPVTRLALANGCHVLSEKPLAESLESAREIARLAGQAGKTYAVMQNQRYDANARALRDFLQTGELGGLTTLHSDFYIGAHFGGFRDHMNHVLLLDMAIHTFDKARMISGADPAAVYCKEWNPAGSWYDHDASAVAVFEMTGGLVYTYRGSWCAEGFNTPWEGEWRAVGPHGSARWDGQTPPQAQVPQGAEGFKRPVRDIQIVAGGESLGGHAGCIHDFLECLRKGTVPETDVRDNIKSLAMVFGAIESARRGARVEIEPGL